MNINFFLTISLLLSCGTEPDDNGQNEINPNIVKIIDCCIRGDNKFFSGDYIMGVMTSDNTIIAPNRALAEITIDEEFNLINVEFIDLIERGSGKPVNYVHFEPVLFKGLIVRSKFTDTSLGELSEIDLINETLITLRDSTYNISSAVYWHGDDSKLIYYSYGNGDGLEAGYYLHNRVTDTDSLLLAHRSPMGPSEMLNGFDLSPDNRKLLIPDVRATPSEVLSPQIVEYDLQIQQADTFEVAFDLSFVRIGLWLRYSPNGTRILYSNFPFGSYTETTNDDSEVGIIELATGEKRVLDVNTNPAGSERSVQLTATWSPDGQHILYGSAPLVMPNGIKGTYSLYLLKNVDDPGNFN